MAFCEIGQSLPSKRYSSEGPAHTTHRTIDLNSPELAHWNAQEALAEAMIPIIGTLHRAKGVTVLLHSRSLVNKSVISILRTHRFARQVGGDELSVEETFPFLQALADLDLGPSKI